MDLNRSARILSKDLKSRGIEIKYTDVLGMIARAHGYKDWQEVAEQKREVKRFDFIVRAEIQTSIEVGVWARTAEEAYKIASSELELDETIARLSFYEGSEFEVLEEGTIDDITIDVPDVCHVGTEEVRVNI